MRATTTPTGPLALHLGLAAIGPGMLTLPYGLGNTGLLWGAVVILCSYTLSIISCLAIYDAAAYTAKRDRTSPPPSYGYLVDQLLDRKWSTILDLALVISGFGGAVSFLIFLGDFVPLALQGLLPPDSLLQFLTQRTPVILLASVLCTILSTTDNGVSHPVLSAIPIVGFLGCLVALVYRILSPEGGVAETWSEDLETLWSMTWSVRGVPSINLFLFAFMMQANVLPTFAAVSPVAPSDALALALLESPVLQTALRTEDVVVPVAPAGGRRVLYRPETYNKRLGTLTRSTLVRSLISAHSLTLLYYTALACLGVILVKRTGLPIPQNFTQALPSDDLVYIWLRSVLVLCLLVLSPYLFSAVANGCMNLVSVLRGRPMVAEGFGSFKKRLSYSFALVFISALVALRTDRVATVLTIFGGWGATVLMCTFPAVLYLKIAQETNYLGLRDKLVISFCIITSIVGFVAAVLPCWIE